MEDSEHAWHKHHLPAAWLQTAIGLGSGGQKGKWGLGEGQLAIGGAGGLFEGATERLLARGEKKTRIDVFPVLPCPVALIDRGKSNLR